MRDIEDSATRCNIFDKNRRSRQRDISTLVIMLINSRGFQVKGSRVVHYFNQSAYMSLYERQIYER